jgi:hypothetical protein
MQPARQRNAAERQPRDVADRDPRPTVETRIPKAAAKRPLNVWPMLTKALIARPMIASQKYS